MKPPVFRVITGRTVHALVERDRAGCVEVVRLAYEAHGRGDSINPNSSFLRGLGRPAARIIALPARLGGAFDVAGIKWIASYPGNVASGLPRASAVLVLNDAETGYPFACLEASIVSAARTAASAVLAAQAIRGGNQAVATLGIVGTGLIARHVYEFLLGTGWQIGRLLLHDLVPGEAERFGRESGVAGGHPRGVAVAAIDDLLRSSEVIVFATTAGQPHVHDVALFAHNPVVLHVSLRDLAPEILLASQNIVDDVGHVMNADTSPHLAEQLTGGRDFVTGALPELLAGGCRLDPSRPTIFSPFGLGVLDLALGQWIHDQAVPSGMAIEIPEFFHELRR